MVGTSRNQQEEIHKSVEQEGEKNKRVPCLKVAAKSVPVQVRFGAAFSSGAGESRKRGGDCRVDAR